MMYYANLYGLKYQAIFRMKERGYSLSNPAKLLKSIEDQKGGNKPNLTVLRRIVNGDASALDDERPPAGAHDNPDRPQDGGEEAEDPDVEAAQFSMALAGGLMEELSRLKDETARAHRLYVAEKRPADKALRCKVWLSCIAALRQLAKEAPKAERDAKNVLVVGDVDSTWSRALKEFKTAAEALGRRVSTLPLFAQLDPIDVEEVIAKETTTMLSHLESGSWLTRGPKE